jgi:peroxiredoxin
MTNETTAAPIYATYWLYRVDRKFARLGEAKREQSKKQFLAALEARERSVRVRGVYAFAGLRADADLMLWLLTEDLDALQRLAIALRKSGLGKYLIPVETYVGVTTPARYDPQHMPAFLAGVPPKRYISVYPFVKTAEWYLLPYERRRELMGEHGYIGRRYAVSREKLAALREAGASSDGHSTNGARRVAACWRARWTPSALATTSSSWPTSRTIHPSCAA